ncbi:MAG: NotI family restriction endonuclease, partial [Candidatus Binatia bacterium]
MPRNPLAEVFGFPPNNFSEVATRHRANKFCPFHNSSGPRCTKNSAIDPLCVCSVQEGDIATITCAVRFLQDWLIAADAATFFFPARTCFT